MIILIFEGMKGFLFCFFIFGWTSLYGQVSGDIIIDQRKVVNDISYTMEMKGGDVYMIFDIAVNTEGKVTSCQFNKAESTTSSRRYTYEAKNLILMQLTFEKGNGYPTFHRGKVKISAI